jgi:hypothetical protein
VRALGTPAAIAAAIVGSISIGPADAAQPGLSAVVTPAQVAVGDVFEYTITLPVAPNGAPPELADVVVRSGPFQTIGPPQLELDDRRARIVHRFACLSTSCVPREGPRQLEIPAARVGRITVAPVAVLVRPRVSPAAVRGGARAYLRETHLPPVDGRVGPTAAVRALAVAAAALVLLAAALIAIGAPWRRAGRSSPLNRAIRLLRESAHRSAADRRRAGDLLARASPAAVAEDARAFAWSKREPSPDAAKSLAARAEG